MFLLNIHESESGSVVSVCDSDSLGKTFEEKDTVLDISNNFYGGNKASIETIITTIEKSASSIIVGNNIISVLEDKNIISSEHVRSISGEKYAIIFNL